MVGFILACTGHRYRAVAGSNPALPTNSFSKNNQNAAEAFMVVHIQLWVCMDALLFASACDIRTR
jgi:hypothetical protein